MRISRAGSLVEYREIKNLKNNCDLCFTLCKVFVYSLRVTRHQLLNHDMKVSDAREEKARINGDSEAWIKGKQIEAYEAGRKAYLQAHPEVGTLIRNGKELFYVNLQPYHLGKIREFTPASVIKIG